MIGLTGSRKSGLSHGRRRGACSWDVTPSSFIAIVIRIPTSIVQGHFYRLLSLASKP
jgi:hypothetical protein